MVTQEPVYDVGIAERLRFLEKRHESLREKTLVINKNVINSYKEVLEEIKSLEQQQKELKENIVVVQDALKDIVKEMNNFVDKSNFKTLEKYMKIWNPLNYVTEEEVLNLIHKKKDGK